VHILQRLCPWLARQTHTKEQHVIKDLDDLILGHLKDIYFAERQLLKALPKMARSSLNDELKQAFTTHRDETERHVDRLKQAFEAMGKRPQGKTCEAIKGLIEECEELLEDAPEPSAVRDAGLIACGQAVEHYEMARYGAIIAWAKAAGRGEIAMLLQTTLEEEKTADRLLDKLATGAINAEAAKVASATKAA
jgi:ferritin-like metal-binding protein YciE